MSLLGHDIWGKRFGIVGMGRIGAAVARRVSGFGMEVVYHSRIRNGAVEKEPGAIYSSLDDLLSSSDFVSVHTPLIPATRHLIGKREISLMQPNAVLVNTSRGPIVHEAALAEALESRRIFAAGLDVYEHEPDVHPKLLGLENVVLLPHKGSASVETRNRMAQMAARSLQLSLPGERPPNVVNPQAYESAGALNRLRRGLGVYVYRLLPCRNARCSRSRQKCPGLGSSGETWPAPVPAEQATVLSRCR